MWFFKNLLQYRAGIGRIPTAAVCNSVMPPGSTGFSGEAVCFPADPMSPYVASGGGQHWRKKKRGKQMKSFMKEFKEFISRGNVMDMAVGIIIGGAFTSIVTSLVDDVINPILGCFGGVDFSNIVIPLVGDASLKVGNFINAIINFLIMAFILFSIIKAMNTAAGKIKKEEEEAAPTTKMCPYCRSEDVPIEATRCPHCTSQLEEKAG